MSSIFNAYYSRGHLSTAIETYSVSTRAERPPALHHYSSAAGAANILSTGKLWATSVRYLNDASELRYGQGIVEEVLSQRYAHSGGPDRSWIKQVNLIATNMLEAQSIFTTCFCEDGDLLSQWRAYGSESGIAIGFDAEALAGIARTVLMRVIYDPASQREKVGHVLSLHKDTTESGGTVSEGLDGFQKYSRISLDLALLAVSFKHPSFAEEKEWRLLPSEVASLKFRVDAGLLKPYLELDVKSEGLSVPLLRAVTVGPGRHAALTKISLQMLLAEYGYESVPVQLSNVPLR